MTPNELPQRIIKVSQLKLGDLIFWIRPQKIAHAEIYGGNTVFSKTSFHAVNDTREGYPRSLIALSFTPLPIKRVYRCKVPGMAARAAKYAKRWAAFETKYDQSRFDFQKTFADQGGADRAALMVSLFYERGRYQAVKVAARRETILCYPGEVDGLGMGTTCHSFVLKCFHAAFLADYVKVPYFTVRVSDKKLNLSQFGKTAEALKERGFDDTDITLYHRYLNTLHETLPYGIEFPARVPAAKMSGVHYYPSLWCWKKPPFHSFNFERVMTPGLLLDSKAAYIDDFWRSIHADSAHWEDLGSFPDVPAPEYSAFKKNFYQNKLNERKEAATKKRRQFIG